MNLDSKTLSVIIVIVMQSISFVWFLSKMDNRIANNQAHIEEILTMHMEWKAMEKKVDKLSWLLEQDARNN